MKTPHLLSSALLALAALMTASSTGSAAVLTLEFADGNGTTSVDQYQGVSGSGWTSAWTPTQAPGMTTTATVLNTTPLVSGGGNYLQVTAASSGVSGASGGVGREFDTTSSGVNVSLDHSYSFNLRVDTIGTIGGINIFNNTSIAAGPGSASSWIIYANPTGNWLLRNGNRSGGVTGDVDTGMTLTAGTTYSFTINVDEDTNSWVAKIDNGSTTYTSGTLGFRTSAATDGDALNFTASNVNTASTWVYSIDSVSVIPEPSTYALLALGLTSLALLRRGGRFSRQAR